MSLTLKININRYLEQGKTGQIVIKLKNEKYLTKVYIEKGEIVYISMGNKDPLEIIDLISTKELEDINFIKDVKISKRLNNFIKNKIKNILESYSFEKKEMVVSEKICSLIEDFIDIIGPIGIIISDNYLRKIGYTKGTNMDLKSYISFVKYLIQELPIEKRESFKNKYLNFD